MIPLMFNIKVKIVIWPEKEIHENSTNHESTLIQISVNDIKINISVKVLTGRLSSSLLLSSPFPSSFWITRFYRHPEPRKRRVCRRLAVMWGTRRGCKVGGSPGSKLDEAEKAQVSDKWNGAKIVFKYVGRTGNISRGRSEGFHFKHDFGIKKEEKAYNYIKPQ